MVVTRPPHELTEFHGMLTASPQMRAFFQLLERVAQTEATVLVRGRTGTGKELVAKALHLVSRRSEGPFKAINCATLTSELLASELFGHVRGAFTGAVRDRKGLFALADGGTVFLDEVAEISPRNQARLLRVLQERTFVPVGGTEAITVDVRIVSATNKALRKEVAAHRFREDLMYRLRVVPLFLPPLVERDGDIEALAWHFIEQFNKRGQRRVESIDEEALRLMRSYDWPGNVRELSNLVELAFAIGIGPTLTEDELPPELRGEGPIEDNESKTAVDDERDRIRAALRRFSGRKGEAARHLGMSRSTLWRKMREHRL